MYVEIIRQYAGSWDVYRDEIPDVNPLNNFLCVCLAEIKKETDMLQCKVVVYDDAGTICREFTAFRNVNGTVRGKIQLYTPEDDPENVQRVMEGMTV